MHAGFWTDTRVTFTSNQTNKAGRRRREGFCALLLRPLTHKFTGKERGSESSLDNFGARYDSSSMGRFTSPDDTSADDHEGDPQGLNLYSYVQDNPINYCALHVLPPFAWCNAL